LAGSIVIHLAGYLLINVLRNALVEAGDLLHWSFGPVFADPYIAALQFSVGKLAGSSATSSGEALTSLAAFVSVIVVESAVAFCLVTNPGLDIVAEPVDIRGQGWVYDNVVRPLQHGYTPIAYVLTNITADDRGVGYEGVVADIRQGADGEIKTLSLAAPSRFIYELRGAKSPKLLSAGRKTPDMEIYDSEWIGGVIALEPATIRNVVIHIIKEQAADDVVDAEKSGDDVD
jgi:hypothetical protein